MWKPQTFRRTRKGTGLDAGDEATQGVHIAIIPNLRIDGQKVT
jgi:hypothetical protein